MNESEQMEAILHSNYSLQARVYELEEFISGIGNKNNLPIGQVKHDAIMSAIDNTQAIIKSNAGFEVCMCEISVMREYAENLLPAKGES